MNCSGLNFNKTLIILMVIFCSNTFAERFGIIYNSKNTAIDSLIKEFTYDARNAGHSTIEIDIKTDVYEKLLRRCDYTLNIGYKAVQSSIQAGKNGIYLFIPNPEKLGLIDNEQDHQTFFHGISVFGDPEKKLQLLAEILPQTAVIGLVYNPANIQTQIENIVKAGKKHNFSFKKIEINSHKNLKEVKNLQGQVGCILLEYDNTILDRNSYSYLLRFSIINKIPIIGISSNMTKSGALISFHHDYKKLGKQAFDLITKLAEGSLTDPLVYGNTLSYSINQNTAAIMKIYLSKDIKDQAEQLF